MGINRAVTPYKQELARKLNVYQLTAFGMNYIMPFAPAIIFGIIAKRTGTTVALPYLLALIVMSFTANSYIYMVKRNPVAGSLYSYVESIFGKKVGFLAGWILFLDYILIPTVVAISATLYLKHYLPDIPYSAILSSYVVLTGLLNLFGISIVANVGMILLIAMELLLAVCLIIFGHHVISDGHSLLSSVPFRFDSLHVLFTATTLCVLSYLGYDAISTLAEEAKHPVRDIPKAIIFSVIFSATMMFLIGYLGVLALPNITANFGNEEWVNSALFYIVNASSGQTFTAFFTAGVILCMGVFNIVSTAAGARLLFGMGRDRVIPKNIFGKVNQKFRTPHYNILLIMLIELIVGLSITLDTIVDLVNFGAILGFSILNLAVFYRILTKDKMGFNLKRIISLLAPLFGVLSMVVMIVMMDAITLIVGITWTVIGVIYLCFNKYLKPYEKSDSAEILKHEYNDKNNVLLSTVKDVKELERLKNCWNYDHWNISDTLVSTILKVDQSSLILINGPEEVIGSIVAYNYDDHFGYFGLFYIRPEFQGKNYGAYLTGAALQRWGHRFVACDAVYSQVNKYEKIGFTSIYENRRYVFTPQGSFYDDYLDEKIININDCDIKDIAEYDAKHFYTNRIETLKIWFGINQQNAYVYLDDNIIKGLISITPAHEACRIGPFYADNPEIAEKLLAKASSKYIGELINIDMPLINENSQILIDKFSLTEAGMKLIRMHKGYLPVNNINAVYGHLSIEIG